MNESESPHARPTNSSRASRSWPDYRAVWRWHFYAGVFCIPFVILLSLTGTIYLFRPQIEAWQERTYDRLPHQGVPAPLSDQVRAATASVDGGKFAGVEHPTPVSSVGQSGRATRVLVDQAGQRIRVYVDPIESVVVGSVAEEERLLTVVKRLHGELLLGKRGSYFVELAASWTIVMVLTGMVLWLPRRFRLAGVLYPRWTHRGRPFWKDLHSVGGFWASGLILFLVATGLPWATFWGGYFKSMRQVTGTAAEVQHWDGGHAGHQSHAGHSGHAGHAEHSGHAGQAGHASGAERARPSAQPKPRFQGPSWRRPVPDPDQYDLAQLDRVSRFAASLDFRPPVVISPPTAEDSIWTIQSETANRPEQQTVQFNAASGKLVGHETFADRHWVDRLVGQGIALHEGQRFGIANQMLALLATLSLLMLSCTGIVLWWRRRNTAGLSPPAMRASHVDHGGAISRSRIIRLGGVLLIIAVYLPLFGLSLLIVLAFDWLVVSRVDPLSVWLGRQAPRDVSAVSTDG